MYKLNNLINTSNRIYFSFLEEIQQQMQITEFEILYIYIQNISFQSI